MSHTSVAAVGSEAEERAGSHMRLVRSLMGTGLGPGGAAPGFGRAGTDDPALNG